MRLLLERGASLNAVETDGSTPLHSADADGSVSTMRLLIEHGAEVGDKSKDGSVPALAAHYGPEDAVRFLASKGADVADRRALKFANRQGGDSIARMLNGDQADASRSPRSEVLNWFMGRASRNEDKKTVSTEPAVSLGLVAGLRGYGSSLESGPGGKDARKPQTNGKQSWWKRT